LKKEMRLGGYRNLIVTYTMYYQSIFVLVSSHITQGGESECTDKKSRKSTLNKY